MVTVELETRTKFRKTIVANTIDFITGEIANPSQINGLKQTVPPEMIMADDSSMSNQIDLLIGNDYYFSFIKLQKINIKPQLYLIDSLFGWIWSGTVGISEIQEPVLSVITYVNTNSVLQKSFTKPDLPLKSSDVKPLWELEAIGITDSPKSNRDDEAIEVFNKTTQYVKQRYEVKWPCIYYPPDLPENFGLAL